VSKLAVCGVFCASPGLMETVPGTELALVRLTMRRVLDANLPTYALVPWTSDLDHLAAELKGWRYLVQRTHPDERIAMRDLVARHRADIGVVVNGACAVIDEAEIALAVARLEHGVDTRNCEDGQYHSDCVKALHARDWLRVSDDSEWPHRGLIGSASAVTKFYGTHDMEKANARAVWAQLRGQK
jgi:hypothetical protein